MRARKNKKKKNVINEEQKKEISVQRDNIVEQKRLERKRKAEDKTGEPSEYSEYSKTKKFLKINFPEINPKRVVSKKQKTKKKTVFNKINIAPDKKEAIQEKDIIQKNSLLVIAVDIVKGVNKEKSKTYIPIQGLNRKLKGNKFYFEIDGKEFEKEVLEIQENEIEANKLVIVRNDVLKSYLEGKSVFLNSLPSSLKLPLLQNKDKVKHLLAWQDNWFNHDLYLNNTSYKICQKKDVVTLVDNKEKKLPTTLPEVDIASIGPYLHQKMGDKLLNEMKERMTLGIKDNIKKTNTPNM